MAAAAEAMIMPIGIELTARCTVVMERAMNFPTNAVIWPAKLIRRLWGREK
jgi:hypothetical protein